MTVQAEPGISADDFDDVDWGGSEDEKSESEPDPKRPRHNHTAVEVLRSVPPRKQAGISACVFVVPVMNVPMMNVTARGALHGMCVCVCVSVLMFLSHVKPGTSRHGHVGPHAKEQFTQGAVPSTAKITQRQAEL